MPPAEPKAASQAARGGSKTSKKTSWISRFKMKNSYSSEMFFFFRFVFEVKHCCRCRRCVKSSPNLWRRCWHNRIRPGRMTESRDVVSWTPPKIGPCQEEYFLEMNVVERVLMGFNLPILSDPTHPPFHARLPAGDDTPPSQQNLNFVDARGLALLGDLLREHPKP